MISDEKALATLMNNYFVNIRADLGYNATVKFFLIHKLVNIINRKFQDHQSISKIKEVLNEIQQEVSILHGSKVIPLSDITAGMLKSTIDFYVYLLTKIINSSLRNWCFPDKLKAAEIILIFKKNDDLDKENCRPVSVLFHVSNIFERIIYIQIENFMEDKLSKLLTSFRINHITQHC